MNVFTLYGSLSVDTSSFEKHLRDAQSQLKSTESAITKTEQRAKSIGQTSATSARGFERLNESIQRQRDYLLGAAAAYQRGEIGAKGLSKALATVDNAAARINSRLRDTSARLTDVASKSVLTTSAFRGLGAGMSQVGNTLATGLTLPLLGVGAAFIRSATSIDGMRNRLIAATGTIDAANAKMVELRQLAQSNAGVFTASAVEMYAFLKPMQIGDKTIDTMIKAMGRLKLANEDLDTKQMAMNMTQLFTQSFERTDLKEAIGNFPRFGEILQKAFNLSGSDLGTIGEEMKAKLAAGLSKEQFFAAIANAIQNDPSLSKLSDTVGIRFQKMMERVFIAFEPIGNAILGILEPLASRLTPIIESISTGFQSLSPTMQGVVLAFGAIAAAAGPALIAIGAIVTAVTSIVGAISAIGGLVPVAAVVAVIAAGLAQLAVVAGTLYAAWQTNFGGIRDLVQEVGSFVSEQWSQAMTEISSITETVVAEVRSFWETNGADIIAAVKKISDGIKAAWQGVAQFWRENGDNIREITSSVWEVVKSVVIGAVKAIGGVIKTVAAVINGDWSKAWEGLKDIVSVAWQGILGIIRGMTNLSIALIKAAFNAIWALSSWINAQAVSLGVYLVQGFINGITSMVGALISAAQAMARAPITAAKAVLDEHSPSRVFFDIGQNVGQGFVNGIAAMKPATQKAMTSILDLSQLKGKGNAAGLELAESLRNEVARLGVTTKLGEVMLDLEDKKYAGLDARIKELIKTYARQNDAYKDRNDYIKLGANELERLVDLLQNEDIETKKVNEALASMALKFAVANEKLHPLKAGMNEMIVSLAQLNSQMSSMDWSGLAIPERASIGGTTLGNGDTPDDSPLAIPPPPMKPWESFWQTMMSQMAAFKASMPSIKQSLGENLIDSFTRIGDVFGQAFAQWDGTAQGFFKSLAQGFRSLVSQIVSELMRLLAMKAVFAIIGAFAGAAGGQGNTSSLGSGEGMFSGGDFGTGGFADGGMVSGRGTSTSDSIWARLSNGEFVMNAKSVRQWGRGFFDTLNAGFSPMAFAGGGYVGGFGGGSITTTNNNQRSVTQHVSINVSGGSNPKQTAQQIQRELMMAANREEMRNK